MRILFLHGCNSVPGGETPTYLKDHGHEVITPERPHETVAADTQANVQTARPPDTFHQPPLGASSVGNNSRNSSCQL